MTTFDAGSVTLEKVRENVWEIPQKGDMRVPARVFASEPLLEEIAEDRTLEQLRNTTHLPGIRKYAVCMPDGHQGYGFPVGGVAGIDAEDGCISPGSVGYDINCLAGDAEVRLPFGRRIRIDDLESRFEDERAMVVGETLVDSPIRLFTAAAERTVYEVETATGDCIRATADHPFQTPDGMCKLDELEPGETVHIQPFRGVEDDAPAEKTLLTEADFADEPSQILEGLSDANVLPLTMADEPFNHLLKILGYFTGNGAFGDDGRTWLYGEPDDLERLQEDLRTVGFDPSTIRSRDGDQGDRTSATAEACFKTTSKAFQRLLQALGAPIGEQPGFTTPWYFSDLTDWQKVLYYSAYFGAEMTPPAAERDQPLDRPTVSHTCSAETVTAGRRFLRDLREFLSEIGIEATPIEAVETDRDSSTAGVRLQVGIENNPENLLRFFSTVGYRYDHEKRQRAVKALQYLKTRQHATDGRQPTAGEGSVLADGGMTAAESNPAVDHEHGCATRSLEGERAARGRAAGDGPGFEEFCEACDVGENLVVETEIVAIEEAGREPVYDIGVAHEAHNFIAEGFVVSNCGVRMVRTDLTYDDLRGRETELVEALFANVPTGLGTGGVFEGSVADVEAILDRGLDWALEHDYAVPADLEHCEDEGQRPESDPDAVSQEAKERGATQVGSLGSGNHFLEVQRVTDLYREDVAAEFGLRADQIVVLIHCGSRGLGHQVCTDYLREIEQTHAGLLSQLPDKELAAAPAGSQLADAYYRAMGAAINFAWVNRQLITYQTRRVFERIFDEDWEALGMDLLYDVAHNIAKKEVHDVGDEQRELYVHRKGATRAFPAGRPEVPRAYRDVGQPIIIPGSMGAGSYVLRGGAASLTETFGSTAHGAGRLMSRTQAKNEYWGEDVMDDLREQSKVYVKAQSGATVAEEAPGVYKDVDEVVRVSDALGIGDRVARTFPVCNIKG